MNRFYLLTLLLFTSFGTFAQTGFQNSFGDTTADFGTAIIQSTSGMYVIIGATQFESSDSTEVAVYFVDALGDLILSTTIGLPGQDYPSSIVEATDGNFIITGHSYASPLDTSSTADIFATKVSSIDGYEVWTHYYGGQNEDRANSIIATPDGNYLIAGSTRSFGPFNQSALAMKIDDNGDLIWCKITGIGVETEYNSAVISADTSYILCGSELDGNGSDLYITKMRSDGTVVWTNQIGSTADEMCNSIALTADSGFIIGGSYIDPLVSSEDQLITKLDSNGNFVWAKSYSTVHEDIITSIMQNAMGNYIATGYSNTDTTGLIINNLTLGEYDINGTILWANSYGSPADISEGYGVIKSIDDGYACVGTTYGTGDPNGDVYLMKTDTSGLSGCDELPIAFSEVNIAMNVINAGFENLITPDTITYSVNSNDFTNQYVQMCFWDGIQKTNIEKQASIYPNPSSGSVTIEGDFDGCVANIYDRVGQLVISQNLTGNKTQLNTSVLSQGLYFVRITSEKASLTLKFIKQ